MMNPAYSERHRLLGINIAYYRNIKGLTQAQMADILGVEQSHVSRMERAAIGISLERLYQIADALDVEPFLLLKPKD